MALYRLSEFRFENGTCTSLICDRFVQLGLKRVGLGLEFSQATLELVHDFGSVTRHQTLLKPIALNHQLGNTILHEVLGLREIDLCLLESDLEFLRLARPPLQFLGGLIDSEVDLIVNLPHIVGSFTARYHLAACVLLLRDVVGKILEVSIGRRRLRAGCLCSSHDRLKE
ncbi:hypothetical protein BGW80DRAFT_57330 [Lactifluus volemus]|nr:hypothetical protein BGW80DRAFT_57330 [Lactifluus volemus]